MRIYQSILLATLAAGVFLSCDDKQNYYTLNVPETVDVVSGADIAFKAIGGEGDIEVAPVEGQLQATTSQSWCHLTVQGNKIHVSVDENESIESRYARVEMKAGEASGVTVVHQYGVIVRAFSPQDLSFKNAAQDYAIPYDANETTIRAESDATDWLTVVSEANVLRVLVSENTDKGYRKGTITWHIGEVTDTFTVEQFDARDAGLLGDWTVVGLGGTNMRTENTFQGVFSEVSDGNYSLHLTRTNMDLTIDGIKMQGLTMLIPLGGNIGTYNAYVVFPLISNGTQTTTTTYEAAIHSGYLPVILSKDETTGQWTGVEDISGFGNGILKFECWTTAEHAGVSRTRFAMKEFKMTKD